MRPEVAKYQPQLDILVGFVEGRLDGPALFDPANGGFETVAQFH